MFTTTFIGHQGWLFDSGETRLLVDPILTEYIGHGSEMAKVYPPRRVQPAAFPPIDAVLLTHEHDDHFNIPSLNRLDRRIPVLLSDRSSNAARTILDDMGFVSYLVRGGQRVRIGNMEILLFTPDYTRTNQSDEWDVLQFAVRDTEGDGSFFSTVDAAPTDDTERQLHQLLGKPGVVGVTNNAADWSCCELGATRAPHDSLKFTAMMIGEYRRLTLEWGAAPAAMVVCGGGYSFFGDREWLNRNVFCTDATVACTALSAIRPGELFLAARPGHTLRMEAGRVTSVEPSRPFLSTLPESDWPSRRHARDVELMESYSPACGRQELTDEALGELVRRMDELAQYLYAGTKFKSIYSLSAQLLQGRKATFAVVVIADADGGSYVLEYEPQGCRFRIHEGDDEPEYVTGFECWGTDLLALFRGELGPTSVLLGRSRGWSHAPAAIAADTYALWEFFHPLRRPDTFTRYYRRLLAAEPLQVPRVPAPARRVQVEIDYR